MYRRYAIVFSLIVLAMMLTAQVASAQTATPVPSTAVPATAAPLSFDIDVQPLFDAIQLYLPPLLAILAIGGGIKIAIKLAGFLIDSISGAFGGT